MTTQGQGCCARCGAVLRRRSGVRGQVWCDPCRRSGPDPRRDLPAGFYFQDPVAAALGDYDFRSVFRRIRMATEWPQQTLAEVVGLEQSRISAIERGVRSLRDVALVAQVATRLGIPPILLGFGATVGAAGGDGQRVVSWVDRRDFVEHVGILALSASGALGLDVGRLIALLPHADPTGTRHVGVGDVEAIEQAVTAFRRQDFTQGSGRDRDAALTQLRATLPLLDAEVAPEVRPRLLLATADLATQAGWMSFDVNQQDAARRLWLIALDLARTAEHPHGSDLTVYLLADMALQAVHLQRPDEALRLVHLGHTAAVSAHPVSASTTSLLANIQARTHAVRGDAAGCDRALGHALEHFAAIDPASAPPWTGYLCHTGVSGHQGSARYMLALHARDPHAASQAAPLLREAVDTFGPGYARLRALYLPDLAGAHALAGDTDTALTVGHQAIDAVTALHSPNAYDRLRILNTALEPLRTSPGVTELRDRLTSTAA
ncbi:MAG: helix-turn-helix domain-containing protein [Pseudonocardiaceae bacterium]